MVQPTALERVPSILFDVPPPIQEIWAKQSKPVVTATDNTIYILGVIGSEFTADKMIAALDAAGSTSPVTVAINSPGGDMFEGITIFNLLVNHPAKVTMKVYGIAASAASIIAMAGDDIVMETGASMMIHNCSGFVIGNAKDMRIAADIFGKFDASMQSIYASRTGKTAKAIAKLMDDETYMTAEETVNAGFADKTEQTTTIQTTGQNNMTETSSVERLSKIILAEGITGTKNRTAVAMKMATTSEMSAEEIVAFVVANVAEPGIPSVVTRTGANGLSSLEEPKNTQGNWDAVIKKINAQVANSRLN